VKTPISVLADAAKGIAGSEPQVDWRGILQSNLNTLNQVPAVQLKEALDSDIVLLEKVKSLCDVLIQIAKG